MKIIFMGTSAFAAPILRILVDSRHTVTSIYTKRPTESGRGHLVKKSPTHVLADDCGINVETPSTLKTANIESLQQADVIVVAAYGLILPKLVLEAPRYGSINVHPSALPRWRGAAPIERTLMAGDKKTSICIMYMDEGIDTGDIILTQDIDIPEDANAEDLTKMTSLIGGDLLLSSLDLIENGSASRIKQSSDGMIYAHKLTNAEERIDWTRTACEIESKIRALSPKPGAYFFHNGVAIKILKAKIADHDPIYQQEGVPVFPGTVITNKKGIFVFCGDGKVLAPITLQKAGKNLMDVTAFLCGNRFENGMTLEDERINKGAPA